ncbi:MAG: diaminopimelate decarboxylase [Bacteroidota bacterium]
MLEYQSLNTPCYLYDLDLLAHTLDMAIRASAPFNYQIHYAIKANNNPAITRTIAKKGLGVDCVSGNEITESLRIGFDASQIVYAGVGKSDMEIETALRNQIFCINCESIEELEVIDQIAQKLNLNAPVALRVNPGVNAITHRYITTGLEENKFGIHLSQLQQALNFCKQSDSIDFMGLHFHIGSQITDLQAFAQLARKVNDIWVNYDIDQYGGKILNLGGGLGIDYFAPDENPVPDFDSYFKIFDQNLQISRHIPVHFELGRSLVGQSGQLITRVLYTKKGVNKNFVVTDAGMTELMRPSLYQAVHRISNLTSKGEAFVYDVVGPVCESSDVFSKNVSMPHTQRGDILSIYSTGAYAESMTLNYNMRKKAENYFIENRKILENPEILKESY